VRVVVESSVDAREASDLQIVSVLAVTSRLIMIKVDHRGHCLATLRIEGLPGAGNVFSFDAFTSSIMLTDISTQYSQRHEADAAFRGENASLPHTMFYLVIEAGTVSKVFLQYPVKIRIRFDRLLDTMRRRLRLVTDIQECLRSSRETPHMEGHRRGNDETRPIDNGRSR
jgi:hypothetical protein